MITHSLIIAVLESYSMVDRQCRQLAALLPDTWELILIDDGSDPPIAAPMAVPANFRLMRTAPVRTAGEWTQHEAINLAAPTARGKYIVKSDIDHFFTPGAIAAADKFRGEMMLFNRKAGILTADLQAVDIDHPVHSPVDDIFVMRRSLFERLGGYDTDRHYGNAGKKFWIWSRAPEAAPPAGALIYVTPPTHERYHSLERVTA